MVEKKLHSNAIKFIAGDKAMLPQIQPLWEALNIYHYSRSKHFREHYVGMTFEKRTATLLKKVERGELHVELALDEASGRSVGYVVCSVNGGSVGEIESVYVEESYRGRGVGCNLMQNALAWITRKGVMERIVEVSVGNEGAWGFYERFGFLPRKTILEQKKQQ